MACFRSLVSLDYPRDRMEVVVVDDGDDPSVSAVLDPFRGALEITLIRQRNAGPASARNTGATHAKGDFLAFTDDDCAPAPDWLRTLANGFEKYPNAMLGGRTINALPDNQFSSASQLLIDFLYDHYNAEADRARFLASNNLAVAASQFRAINGFDTGFALAAGEDREFCDRWVSLGYRLVYAPEAVVYHSHALTPFRFVRQHFGYGRGAYAYHRIRGGRSGGGVRVEPWSFYGELLRYPSSKAPDGKAPLLTGLFAIMQAASVSGFFWERARGSFVGQRRYATKDAR